ncbi:MAG: lysophospholipid acyltransferase family protein [Acidobacteria bacterium]|nr:lysophospholipid acyltransferase family protein [Acidobacteriota bacterium]
MARLRGFKTTWAATAIRWVIQILGATWRVRVVAGEEIFERIRTAGEPVVFSFWHNRVLFCAYSLYRRFLRHRFPIAILVSHSGDGELGAHLARAWGAGVVRGSTSRGGSVGLRQLYRAVSHGSSAVTIPDGPRGPLYRCQPGVVVLAQMTGAPILPMAFASRPAWKLGSWDRLIVPKPFARVHLAVGEPLIVPRELTGEDLESEQRRVEIELDRLVREVEESFGVPSTDRPPGGR